MVSVDIESLLILSVGTVISNTSFSSPRTLSVGEVSTNRGLMAKKPIGYGVGLSTGNFEPKEQMPYPPDSWLVGVWVETGIVGLILYLGIHGILFAWCSWLLMFKVRNKSLRGLVAAWLCMDAGYFIAAYVNDVMQYPNPLTVYIGFALCFAAPHIDKRISEEEKEKELVATQKN